MSMANPTRAERLATLRQLLLEARYTSQGELSDALAAHGIVVSQPTLSKDLLELGAVRQRAVGGALVYAAPGDDTEGAAMEKLARLCAELLQSIRHAGTQGRAPGPTHPRRASMFTRRQLLFTATTMAAVDAKIRQ